MKVAAIAGGSGSGKSHFVRLLTSQLQDNVSVLHLDNYYKPRETQHKDKNGIENFDLPEAFDDQQLLIDIRKLKEGKSLIFKQYNYNNPNLLLPKITVKPAPILLIEGIFSLSFQSIANEIDFKIFIETDLETALKRRVKRDLEERGYDEIDVRYRYVHHAYPAYQKYILPHKSTADIVISSNETIDNQIQQLISNHFFQL